MHHVMGEHAGAGGWGFVRGGMGTITQAIAKAGREKGMEIRTNAAVASIDTAGGRATGVTLEDGTQDRGRDRRQQCQRQVDLSEIPARRPVAG